MKFNRKETDDKKFPKLKRDQALMIREMESDDDEERGYVDFRVRLSSDFRRPLWSNYDGGITYETLVHTKDALMTDYIDRGLSFVQVRSHYSGDRPGKIVERSIEFVKDKGLIFAEGTARIVDDGDAGTSMIKRWRNLVDRNLSIDYEWREWTEHTDKDTKDTDIIVERWRMDGVSGVGRPADEEAGLMNERDLKLLREALQMKMKRDKETKETEVDPVVGEREDPPADPPVVVKREDTDVKPALVKDREDKPDYDAMRGFIDEDYDSAIKALGDKDISGSARTKIEELKGEAYGRLNHGLTYTRGSVQSKIFEFLATHKEGGMRINEEFKLDGEGKVDRDASKNSFIRSMADGWTHLQKARGNQIDFAAGALDFASGNTTSRNVGAARELHFAMLDGMEPSIRGLMEGTNGIMMPPDMLMRMQAANPNLPDGKRKDELKQLVRDFTVAENSGNKGGNLVQTDVWVDRFVYHLYASAHLDMLGVSPIMGISSNIQIPTQGAALNPAWQSTEVAAVTASDVGIGAVTTAAKRLQVDAEVSLRLSIQTGGAAEGLVYGMMQKGMDSVMDSAVLKGATNGFTGITATTGVNSGNVSLATAANATRWTMVLSLLSLLEEDNVPTQNLKWSESAQITDNMRGSPRNSSGGDKFIQEGNMLADIPAYVTSILDGDATSDKAAILSDWTHVIPVVYGMPILIENPYSKADEATKVLHFVCFADSIVTQAVRFAVMNINAV